MASGGVGAYVARLNLQRLSLSRLSVHLFCRAPTPPRSILSQDMAPKTLSRIAAITIVIGSVLLLFGAVSLAMNANTGGASSAAALMVVGGGVATVGAVLSILATRRQKESGA